MKKLSRPIANAFKVHKDTLERDKAFKVTQAKMDIKEKNIIVTSHVDGDPVGGIIKIKGKGSPGAIFLVSIDAYAQVTANENLLTDLGLQGKGPGGYQKRFFKNHKVTVDENGDWKIPQFNSFGKIVWMRNAFIVDGWTVQIGPLSPNDHDFPEESKLVIRLIVNEKCRELHMERTQNL